MKKQRLNPFISQPADPPPPEEEGPAPQAPAAGRAGQEQPQGHLPVPHEGRLDHRVLVLGGSTRGL